MNMQAIALAFLSSVTIGGLAWVFLYPLLSGEKKTEERKAASPAQAMFHGSGRNAHCDPAALKSKNR